MSGNNGLTQLQSPLGIVPSGWRLCRLKDLTTKIGSGATPTGGESAYLPIRRQFALIRSQNVFDRAFSSQGLAFISDEDGERLNGVAIQPNDVLLNITGDGVTFGRACLVPPEILPARVNQHVSIVRANSDLCIPGYLLAYLTHPLVKSYIESFNAGGSRRAITKGHIESFIVPLPPLAEQRAIAYILDTLDAKIDLNRRMNQTLEAIIRALFNSWFVAFDPVRAKAAGRQPVGIDVRTAALFSKTLRLVDDRMVPDGWRLGALGDVATNSRLGISPTDLQPGTAYIGLEHMPRRSIALDQWTTADAVVSGKFQFRKGDILFGKLRPYFHKVGVAPLDGVCSTDILVVTPKESAWFAFVLEHISSDEVIRYTDASSGGTRMPRTSWADLARYPLVIPPKPIAEAFDQLMQPLVQKIIANTHESNALAAIRDTLLPKLLSGELWVSDAEQSQAGER